ncbi:glycogen debranching protein GlgX [candidate division KSB1 bacterium]|nr:glycogen debranching protein GlgX [candidate division KSB1 bacterium]
METLLTHATQKKLSPGNHKLRGATPIKQGINFTLFSQYAREVFLLLFDTADGEPTDIIKLNKTENVWHIYVHDIKPGQLYGYKVTGDYNPELGARFNEHKLLIDPYAKALTRKFTNTNNLLLAYDIQSPEKDLKIDARDNTRIVPKSIVVDDGFDWQHIRHPGIPLEKLIIYEVHLKGFTAHPSANVQSPGTYLGFIEKIPYLEELGVNAVELLPIHESYFSDSLLDTGLAEYWGYNTIGFFAPESSYGSQRYPGCQVDEFKTLVRELHKADIEVILDVVYNHTGEGNELGPTISFKGIDNPTYYLLGGADEYPYRYYMDYSGCGNTINAEHSAVTRLIIDSLRYWVEVMHVDGFRFDLASLLTQKKGHYSKDSIFFKMIADDPILKHTKIIAEPWDLTTYQVGNFPQDWAEWNGKFRDTVRMFNKGDAGKIRDLAWRVSGSSDLYGDDGRSPYHSINFITCHDGFTLNDLYSYNNKHNQDNLENNQDGSNNNNSWNCGIEGETDDMNVIRLRKQLIKNAFCCLLFSSGTPMILGGDEFLRTQHGNNNAYCQDNDITWFDWNMISQHTDMVTFCKKAIAFRKRHTILHWRKFFSGRDNDGDYVPDIAWFDENLHTPDWFNANSQLLSYQLDGSENASALADYHLFFILNAAYNLHTVKLPYHDDKKWFRVIDTSLESGDDFLSDGKEILIDPPEYYIINPRSTVVLIGKKTAATS